MTNQTTNEDDDDTNQSSTSTAIEQYLILRTVAISLIDQAIHLLQNVIVSDALLTTVSELVPGSTLGKHLRHLHDHFRILFESAQAHPVPQILNYDSRERNVPMESSHQTMVDEFERLKEHYLLRPDSPFNRHLTKAQLDRYSSSGPDLKPASDPHPYELSSHTPAFEHGRELHLVAITPCKVDLKTTFNRELWFACLHATHHYALIRVIVTGELKLSLPKEFGVAPSTLERSKM